MVNKKKAEFMENKVLIIGITGSIGKEFALACLQRGWKIRALHRDPDKIKSQFLSFPDIEWVKGNAMNKEDVAMAAKGVDVIFHGANPPGYVKWRELALPMLENTIAASINETARLVFPGNVYNFGLDAMPLINEASPQNPISRKGRVRVEMEEMLQQAATKGARVLVVRAGDFFGADAKDSWFQQAIVKPGKKLKYVTYPGKHRAGHNWAYLPDLAETMVQLLEHEKSLGTFDIFHFGGHYFPHGVEIAKKTLQVAGIPNTPIKKMPWMLLKLASPFVTLLRELLEMRYLWESDLKLDNAKLLSLLGEEPHTPIEQALKTILRSIKCL
jgi:nucleoside-diphosphate-sugar epimerase